MHALEGFGFFFLLFFGMVAGFLFAVDFYRSSSNEKAPVFSKNSLLFGGAAFVSLSFVALLYVFDGFYLSWYECINCDLLSNAPAVFFYSFLPFSAFWLES
ncbi:MAG: hypothetical protein QW343_03305 [Candidatus Norongarragalinales archaeon]